MLLMDHALMPIFCYYSDPKSIFFVFFLDKISYCVFFFGSEITKKLLDMVLLFRRAGNSIVFNYVMRRLYITDRCVIPGKMYSRCNLARSWNISGSIRTRHSPVTTLLVLCCCCFSVVCFVLFFLYDIIKPLVHHPTEKKRRRRTPKNSFFSYLRLYPSPSRKKRQHLYTFIHFFLLRWRQSS